MSVKNAILSEYQKEIIVRMREKNVTFVDIAFFLDIGREQAKKYMQRYNQNKDLPPKTITKKLITDGRVGLQIKKIYEEFPKTPYRKVPGILRDLLTPNEKIPSASTVEKYLLKNGLTSKVLIKKAFVRPNNIRKRLDFALENFEKGPEWYEHIIWSDETSIHSIPNKKEIRIRVHASVPDEELPYNPQVQGGGFNVMFWGCFSKLGLGPLVVLEGSQNQTTYVELLKEYVIPELEICRDESGAEFTFMQDNAPCHKASSVIRFFEENEISTLNWPPQSPDLNPIENLWSWIKHKHESEYPFPTSKSELIHNIMHIWEHIPDHIIENLCDSVPNRLKEVIRLNGKPTKY